VLGVDAGRHVLVTRLGSEVGELHEVARARLERPPRGDILPQRLGLAQDLLGRALVVPEVGLGGARIQLREASLPCG